MILLLFQNEYYPDTCYAMKKALVIGGAKGIGLAVVLELARECESVYLVDRDNPVVPIPNNVHFLQEDLTISDFLWLKDIEEIDTLFYSAGFGRVAKFEDLEEKEIDNSFAVNAVGAFKVFRHFMPRLKGCSDFYCGIMVSIAGRIASPLFSIYSATKAALFRGIEAINTELEMSGCSNRILEVSPGSIKGTSFNGGMTNLEQMQALAIKIIAAMKSKAPLYIPEYDGIYQGVLGRYSENPSQFARESYLYKLQSGRLSERPQMIVGYLSGTFDLFHIGHLNLFRRARQHCDYLVVGVHRDGSHKGKQTVIPFEDRKAIVAGIKYVDKVIESEKEDSDVYTKGIVKYDRLFVGSDYEGTERFRRYEEFFKDKGVKIIYFPYTSGISSTRLRSMI